MVGKVLCQLGIHIKINQYHERYSKIVQHSTRMFTLEIHCIQQLLRKAKHLTNHCRQVQMIIFYSMNSVQASPAVRIAEHRRDVKPIQSNSRARRFPDHKSKLVDNKRVNNAVSIFFENYTRSVIVSMNVGEKVSTNWCRKRFSRRS
jgi:hypothetical protein